MQKLSRPTFTLSVREIESCRGFWGNRLGTKSWVHQWKSYTVRKKKWKAKIKKKNHYSTEHLPRKRGLLATYLIYRMHISLIDWALKVRVAICLLQLGSTFLSIILLLWMDILWEERKNAPEPLLRRCSIIEFQAANSSTTTCLLAAKQPLTLQLHL